MAKVKSISTILLGCIAVLGGLFVFSRTASVAQAQRLNIPSTGTSSASGLSGMSPAPTAMTPSVATPNYYNSSAGSYAPSTYGSAPATSTYNATTSPYGSYNAATASPYSVAPASPYGTAPSITSPYPNASTMSSVPVTQGSVAGPVATFQNNAVVPPTTWDPYAPPGSVAAPSLLPTDAYPVVPTMDFTQVNEWRQKFLDEVRIDYYFIPARGSKRFGTNDLELSSTFAFPFLYNEKTPLKVTPGFAFHWWEGPMGSDVPSSMTSLPPRVYDAYIDTAWNPQPTPWFGGELCFRVGVYTDFQRVTTESIRYTGQGLAVITFSPVLKAKLGIVYYDRVKVKLLPAGGLVWTPNENVRFDILFPNPMFSRRMTTMGTTDLWLYLRGEYGGGSWAITPQFPADAPMDQYDYNDLRAALGCEFDNVTGLDALVEVGVSFERELVSRFADQQYNPSTTIFLRVGVTR